MQKYQKILLEPAFILHRRPYRETSALIEVFTQNYGRISVIARGVRKPGRGGLLEPFTPLLISCAGKGELLTLSQFETNGTVDRLQGDYLYAGFYLNELLVHLLQKWDAHPNLYAAYAQTLGALQHHQPLEQTLRSFENYLLEEIGYAMLPKSALTLHNMFMPDCYYHFIPEHGFVLREQQTEDPSNIFLGQHLIAMAKEEWSETVLIESKRLMRLVFQSLLGTRQIHSRQLFIKPLKDNMNEN